MQMAQGSPYGQQAMAAPQYGQQAVVAPHLQPQQYGQQAVAGVHQSPVAQPGQQQPLLAPPYAPQVASSAPPGKPFNRTYVMESNFKTLIYYILLSVFMLGIS